MRLATTIAVGTTSTTPSRARGGTYWTGKCSASWRHTSRPATIPSGTPITTPTIAISVACHAIAMRASRRVNPIERSTARS